MVYVSQKSYLYLIKKGHSPNSTMSFPLIYWDKRWTSSTSQIIVARHYSKYFVRSWRIYHNLSDTLPGKTAPRSSVIIMPHSNIIIGLTNYLAMFLAAWRDSFFIVLMTSSIGLLAGGSSVCFSKNIYSRKKKKHFYICTCT